MLQPKHFRNPMENDDLKFVQEFQAGNKKAFNHLYSKYLPIAENFFSQDDLTRDYTEDYCQDIFIKLLRALQTTPVTNFKSLFFMALLNKKKDLIRHKYRNKCIILSLFGELSGSGQSNDEQRYLLDLLEENNDNHPDSQFQSRELREIIRCCLDQIKDEKRKSIISLKLDGYKEHQIAKMLKLNPHTVSSNWGRGKLFLQNCITEHLKSGLSKKEGCDESLRLNDL
jgi:RNA polymerase sigma factor (sigma-70 family)